MNTQLECTVNEDMDKNTALKKMEESAKQTLKQLAFNSLNNFAVANIALWGAVLVAYFVFNEPFITAVTNVLNALFNKYTSVFMLIVFCTLVGSWFIASVVRSEKSLKKIKETLYIHISNLEVMFFIYIIGVCCHVFEMPFKLKMTYLFSVLVAEVVIFSSLMIKVFLVKKLSTNTPYDERMISALVVTAPLAIVIFVIYIALVS